MSSYVELYMLSYVELCWDMLSYVESMLFGITTNLQNMVESCWLLHWFLKKLDVKRGKQHWLRPAEAKKTKSNRFQNLRLIIL